MIKKKTTFSLKDHLFNRDKVIYLSELLYLGFSSYDYQFDKEAFCDDCVREFPNLELKGRIYHIRDMIYKVFEDLNIYDYKIVTDILIKSLPPELDTDKEDEDFGDYIFAPFGEYIAKYGLEEKNLNLSFEAFYHITKRFSVEFPMRVFINNFPEQSLTILKKWSKDNNYHVRRLCSESLRYRLPWSTKINIDYKNDIIMQILDNLYNDRTMYVRRSVANHLHDISKINLDFVIDILKKWTKSAKTDPKYLDFIIKHSLRTAIKNGDKKALDFVNIKHNPKALLQDFVLCNQKLSVPDVLDFSFDFVSLENKSIQYSIKYLIHFRNSKTKDQELKTFSKKVFNLKNIILSKNESIRISKKHLIKSMTTRTLYQGRHFLEIQINGKSFFMSQFDIVI